MEYKKKNCGYFITAWCIKWIQFSLKKFWILLKKNDPLSPINWKLCCENFTFLGSLCFWPYSSCSNDQVIRNMAPAHPHATGVTVYPVLFVKMPDELICLWLISSFISWVTGKWKVFDVFLENKEEKNNLLALLRRKKGKNGLMDPKITSSSLCIRILKNCSWESAENYLQEFLFFRTELSLIF